MVNPVPWWRDAVCYQVYIRSFADSDGDGVGDLRGLEERLDHLRALGVDALWITPFYASPQHDHGYDVADHCAVDPLFGDLAAFDSMLARAHALGLRVLVDVVPNHTSSAHRWFRAAVAGDPAARERYVIRRGRGRRGQRPPNNWRSVFGGPAWSPLHDLPEGREWYLHLFDSSQPDLNWWNPEVGDELERVLRFWLDRGVDGFRIDVAHGLYKRRDLSDVRLSGGAAARFAILDQPEVHDVYRRWRRVLDSYPGDRIAVAEAWVDDAESMARYIRPDELHQAFNFHWLVARWSAADFRRVLRATFEAVGAGAPTWVLSNHDVVRETTRYGGGEVGLGRARAAALTMLALPGSAYVYQGEELGLEEVDVPPELRQDPAFLRGGRVGRDGCRVPIPWSGTTAPYGFGPGPGQPWLPQPTRWAACTVQAQTGDPSSTLELFRTALRLRRERIVPQGHDLELLETAPGSLAFRRGSVTCVLNCGSRPVRLPAGCTSTLLTSRPDAVSEGRLGADAAAWFANEENAS